MNSALIKEKPYVKLYSPDELVQLNPFRFPEHIAIIMDGNRRWAINQGLPPMAGHWRGAETLSLIIRAAVELGVKTLTVYAFSTENWNRSHLEVKALMRLFKAYLLRQRPIMVEEGIRLNVIGDMTKFPDSVQQILNESLEATKDGAELDLVLALNYGGRDELRRAIQCIAQDCVDQKISKDAISEKMISSYLDTARWKDPDLLIRTSGESRISNFLLWQISYSEVIMSDILWPDFCEKQLFEAVLEYQKRELRLGK